MGALEAGVINPTEGLGAGQCIYVSTEQFCNAGKTDYGAVGLVEALKVSSDTYFFEVGELANEPRRSDPGHGPSARHRRTHRDRPAERDRRHDPRPAWRAEAERAAGEVRTRTACTAPCDIVADSAGRGASATTCDLAVGQGDLLTSPLQMAVAYSTLANAYMHGGDGTVVTPHLGLEIDESSGGLVQSLSSLRRKRHVHLNYSDLSLVMEGIHEAASQPGGTSADVWTGWDQEQHPVYGKTGTAEHAGKEEQSWYMCYVADPDRPIVIAVTVEQGGFGAKPRARSRG